jgi:predicted nuclease of predicted toxin-antitoxin system
MVKFLLDQDVYALTARFLVNTGYDIVTAREIGMSRANDEEILKLAQKQQRILITRDRDYGNLVFVKSIGSGVIYLRILPQNISLVHQKLNRVLETYSEEELSQSFVVVEANGHRIRKVKN